MYLVRVSLFLILVSRDLVISSGIGLCFLLAGGLANCTQTPEEKMTYITPITLSAIYTASQSIFIYAQ
jgi:hypothetical protein